MRILIVDDEEPIRFLLKHILETLRPAYQVVTVLDGEAALRQLQRHSFDLVITDYHLPRLDGLELAYNLRYWWPELPVIIISGNPPPDLKKHLQGLGQADYLKKPFTPGQLVEAVDQALKGLSKETDCRNSYALS